MENKQMNAYMQATEDNLFHTYNRYPVTLEKGEGVYLYDTEGKKYLDFAAGIAVCGLGYGNPELNETLKHQVDQLLHSSNLFYHTTCGAAAAALTKACGLDRVFFTNSGTEAMEGAIKAARAYAYRKGNGKTKLIAMENSFHGRTLGALSVTEEEAYRTPFEPLIPGVSFARFNDLHSVKDLVDDKTCAILVEPVQGEGGIHVADPAFLAGLRSLCDEHDMLLIFDEIQCGMGRTGSMFAWQSYGVKPDLLAMGKGIGNGVPVGAFAATEQVAEGSLQAGDHGTTYGGNPFACAAVEKICEIYERDDLPGHVREVGAYLTQQLDELVQTHEDIKERRGVGLIQGLSFTHPVGDVIDTAREQGLLLISAKGDVIRIVPPLIMEKAQIDEGLAKLNRALDLVANQGSK